MLERKISIIIIFLILGGFLSTCDMPIGLGEKVNTEKPVISMPENNNSPGSFLFGTLNCIELQVEQPFGVNQVYMTIWFNDLDGRPQQKRLQANQYPPCPPWCDDNIHKHTKGLWYVQLDTTGMIDGTIRAQVTAIDTSGNESTTTDIVYTIKNSPPQIEMTIPLVSGDKFDTIDFTIPDKINQSNSLMGIATDLYGIKQGYPHIMIWPVNKDGEMQDQDDTCLIITLDADNAAVSETRKWGVWRPMLNDRNQPLSNKGLKAVQFRWPMVKLEKINGKWVLPDLSSLKFPSSYLPTGTYRYKIRVMDMFGKINIYPYRTDNELSAEKTSIPTEDHPNRFMAVDIISVTGPVIEWDSFNRYYNHEDDFTAEIRIYSPNNMDQGRVYAQIGRIDSHFNETLDEKFNDISHDKIVSVFPKPDNAGKVGELQYFITIPKNKIDNVSSDDSYIHIKAVDNKGNFSILNRQLIIDVDKPELIFTEPFALEVNSGFIIRDNDFFITGSPVELTSKVIFRGTSDDNQRVAKLYYALGKKEVLTLSEESWIDTGLNTITGPIQNHPGTNIDSKWGGSLSSWNWTIEDISDFCRNINETGNDFVKPYGPYGYENNLWELPISFKITDICNNINYYNVVIIIDPDADKPYVEISNFNSFPDNFSMAGGVVRLSGTAKDNEYVNCVMVRVLIQRDEDCFMDISQRESSAAPSVIKTEHESGIFLNPAYSGNKTYLNTYSNFEFAEIIGNKGLIVNWQYFLNSGKSLTAEGKLRRVWVELMAIDSTMYNPGSAKWIRLNQPVTRIELVFSSDIPTIEEITIINYHPSMDVIEPTNETQGRNYSFGETISGFKIIRAKITATAPIASIRVSGDGWAEKDYIKEEFININTPWVIKENDRLYYLFIPLNTNKTNAFLDGIFSNRARLFNIYINVQDSTTPNPFIKQETLNLKIDNYYPSARYTGNKIITGEYYLKGTAWDTGNSDINVQGIDKIIVYLSKGRITNNGFGDPVSFETGTVLNIAGNPLGWVRDNQKVITGRNTIEPFPYNSNPVISSVIDHGTEVTLPFFPSFDEPISNGTYNATTAGLVINGNGNYGEGGKDTRYYQYFELDPLKKEWYVRFTFAPAFKDGKYDLNYVVLDTAGNASHYREEIYVANNHPVIEKIWLGTDINGKDSIENFISEANPGNYYDYSVTNNFKIRNSKFNIRLETKKGNPGSTSESGFNYRLSYVNRNEIELTKNINLIIGDIYTIKNPGSININEWINLGILVKPDNNDYRGVTFTAMNQYHGEGKADIYTYNNVGDLNNTQRTGTFETNIITTSGFLTDNLYGDSSNTTLIRDSDKTKTVVGDYPVGSILPENQRQRFFTIKIWDSTIGKTESEQLADAHVIAIDIDNFDTQKPLINIHPFYWKSPSDNSLYENSRNNGHIELENDLPAVFTTNGTGIYDRDPKVSGKVSFRGKSFDNNVIKEIWFKISNFNNNSWQRAAFFENGEWEVIDDFSDGWKFVIEDSGLPDMNGHIVNWRLDFDSSFINNITNTDNILTVEARDKPRYPNPSNISNNDNYKFDVVPYIAEIITPLSNAFKSNPSTFNRSAKGWYPVRESTSNNFNTEDDRIEIIGFNLNGNKTIVTINGTSLSGVSGSDSAEDKNKIKVRIDNDSFYTNVNTVNSGPLVVTVNSLSSLNNINNNNVQYNKEPNNLNNNNLNDDRYMYIWNTGYLFNNRTAQYPVMRMNNDGTRYFLYASPDGTAQAFYIAVNNNAPLKIESSYNRYINTGLAIDEYGDWYAGVSNITAASRGVNYFAFHGRAVSGQTGNTTSFAMAGNNKRRLVSLANNHTGINTIDEDRVKFPSISARNTAINPAADRGNNTTATRIFLSYYDGNSYDNAVVFHYGAIGASFNTNSVVGGNFADNGGSAATTYGTNSRIPQGQIVADNKSSTVHKGGKYTAAGGFSNGLPVITWYDRINQNLVFSHGGSIPESTANADNATVYNVSTAVWQSNSVIIQSSAGTHVDMTVDYNNNVHLAYYDIFNGGLYYAYIPSTNGRELNSRPDYSGIETVRVDTYLSAGTKIMLNVRQEKHGTIIRYVPYITYFHNSFAETRNSIRVAWRVDFTSDSVNGKTIKDGTDTNDRFTGAWEVMTVPTQTVPLSDEFIFNGVPVTIDGSGVTGRAGGWAGNLPSGSALNYTSIDKSILVGYRTTDWYEGAILKHQIW